MAVLFFGVIPFFAFLLIVAVVAWDSHDTRQKWARWAYRAHCKTCGYILSRRYENEDEHEDRVCPHCGDHLSLNVCRVVNGATEFK